MIPAPMDSRSMTALYPLMTPLASRRRTRCCAAEVDMPVCLPRSVHDMRPSDSSRARMWRSVASSSSEVSPSGRVVMRRILSIGVGQP